MPVEEQDEAPASLPFMRRVLSTIDEDAAHATTPAKRCGGRVADGADGSRHGQRIC